MLGDAIKFSPIYWVTSDYRISIYFPGDAENFWCPLVPDQIVQCFPGGSNQIFSKFPSVSEIFAHVAPG